MPTIEQTIPLRLLMHSTANVRRTGKASGIGELAASIAAHGLRQNLNVQPRDDGRFEVVAGGRRLRALRLLAKAKKLPNDAAIPCLILAEDDDPAEISLAENAVRTAMHPDDQCEAFRALIDGKEASVEEVAARFGVSPAVVRQRLKLSGVSPKLRALYRKGDIGIEQMMALAISDDHHAQEEAWRTLPEWSRSAASLKRFLTQESVPLTDRLARFVGSEAYVGAGGAILRDLFDDEETGYLSDRALVERLASTKMAEAVAAIQSEGWKWVKPEIVRDYVTGYQRVYPDAEDGFSAEDKARAGARVLLDADGRLAVERGLIHPDDAKREAQAERSARDPASQTALPACMVEELTAHRTAALRIELARQPAVALAAVVHALALPLLYSSGWQSCLDLRAASEALERHTKAAEDSPAHRAMAEEGTRWGDLLPGEPNDLFAWCLGQPQEVLLDLLAYLGALTVNAVELRQTSRNDHADALATALSLDMHAWWTPSVEGFYQRLPKAALALAVTEAAVPPLGVALGGLKKAEAARLVSAALAGSAWLPEPLRPQPVAA